MALQFGATVHRCLCWKSPLPEQTLLVERLQIQFMAVIQGIKRSHVTRISAINPYYRPFQLGRVTSQAMP